MSATIQELEHLLASEKIAKIGLKEIVDGFIHGKTYQQLLGITDTAMQECYEASLDYMEKGQYDEAADCFLFLVALNPLAGNLWIQAGLAESHRLHHNEALEAFSMAMMCDPDDPFPHIYSALIYIDRGEKKLAFQCLQVSLALIEEEASFQHVKEQVIKLQTSLGESGDEAL